MKKTAVHSPAWATLLFVLTAFLASTIPALAQNASTPAPAAISTESLFSTRPWEFGPVIQGGVGTGNRSTFSFFSAGVHAGKVLMSRPALPSILRGQFEYAAEFFPLWQSYTPAPHLQPVTASTNGVPVTYYLPYGGGTFNGITLTPIILRWDLVGSGRFKPWVQGAGGLLWTNHKYPPDFYAPYGGTSVWNFTPQFGVGFNYFVKPKRSISFAANAVHISSASLGDHNPGVNASVQFELGYNWWK
jgi:lipid A 3-O-deacylase